MRLVGWILAAVGICIATAGILLGAASVHRDGVNCGSGFGGVSNAAVVADLSNAMQADASGATIPASQLSQVQNDCTSATSDRRTVAWVVTVPGALLAVVGVVMVGVQVTRERGVARA